MRFTRAIMATLCLCLSWATHAEVSVPVIDDLAAEGRSADAHGVPLLIMFYAEDCGYCMVVEDEFLEPMIISGDYDDKVLIRRLRLDSLQPVVDFDGDRRTPGEIAARYSVRVTPTLVFVDGRGRPLTKNLIGLMTIDYYGGYVDERIASAQDTLAASGPVKAAEGPRDGSCAVC